MKGSFGKVRKLQDLKKQDDSAGKRENQIIKTSVVGIVANVVLAAIKAIIGIASNSIAIVLDAVNNIADAWFILNYYSWNKTCF